jgi:predicted small metal-binding protein
MTDEERMRRSAAHHASARALLCGTRSPANADRITPDSPTQELTMTRKYIDCREHPGEMKCTVALSADSENELLEAAVQHAVAVHRQKDSPELRQQLRKMFKSAAVAA